MAASVNIGNVMAAENIEVGSTVNESTESTESDFQIEKITAKNITKTYGNKAFSLGAKTKGNGKLTYKTSDKTTLKKISKLKSGTKYYVRVCSYKESSGEKIQGNYSKAKALKVKVGKLERHTKIVYPQIYKGAKLTSAKVANSKIADAYVSISEDLFIKAYKVGTTTIQLTAKAVQYR